MAAFRNIAKCHFFTGGRIAQTFYPHTMMSTSSLASAMIAAVALFCATAFAAAPVGTVPDTCNNPPDPLTPVPPRTGAPRPHIVLFVIDDFGWANLGLHSEAGPNGTHTPHMDAAASEGILLDRHYTFRWCAPTRASFMTGRMPYRVLEATNVASGGMNMIAAKLRQVGYRTHQVGKWHLGCQMQWMTPAGRGFDSSFGYLTGGEDHFTHSIGGKGYFGCPGIDLFETDHPAYTGEGVYGAYLYNDRVQSIIADHDPAAAPLFLYVATQDTHGPDQVPPHYAAYFDPAVFTAAYGVYNGMGAAADELFGNMTAALKAKNMWANTLVVFSSDNGGPASKYTASKSANNWPLRGGKKTDFEGGVRVAAFVSGGFVPAAVRGSTLDGYLHCSDWYPTFCNLAGGVDCRDATTAARRGVPPVDGFDQWDYLTGAVSASPRTEIMVSRCEHPNQHHIPNSSTSPACTGAFISGQYKIVLGEQYYGFWQGPTFPNASTEPNRSVFDQPVDCGLGCLFDIRSDPSETVDLAASNPAQLAQMRKRYFELNATQFDGPRCPPNAALCQQYVAAHHGYLGPIYEKGPPPPPLSGPFRLEYSSGNGTGPALCLVPTAEVTKLRLVACAGANASAASWFVGVDGPVSNALQTRNGSACLKMHDTPGGDCGSWTQAYLGKCSGGPAANNSFSLAAGATLKSNQCTGRCVIPRSSTVLGLDDCLAAAAAGWDLVTGVALV